MKNYKVYIWDIDNPGHRIYLVQAEDKDDVLSKFDNILRNNPNYRFESTVELIFKNIPQFQNFFGY